MMQFINWLTNLRFELASLLTEGTRCSVNHCWSRMSSQITNTNTHVQRASTSDLLVNIPPHGIKLRFSCLGNQLAHSSQPLGFWKDTKVAIPKANI